MDVLGIVLSVTVTFNIYAILSVSLNLEAGYTGIPNFGKVAFQAIGAFITAWFSATLLAYAAGITNVPLWDPISAMARVSLAESSPLLTLSVFAVSLVLAMLASGAFGFLLSYPGTRVKGIYLSLVLLASGEIVRIFARTYTPLVGGTGGLGALPGPFVWMRNVKLETISYAVLTSVVLLAVYFYSQRLTNSPYGRLLRSVRDDELASSALGKNVPRIKREILIIGSAMAGIAGCLFAFRSSFVSPDDFGVDRTFTVWLMFILGGKGNNRGALAGALVITLIERATASMVVLAPGLVINYVRYIVVAVILLVVLMYRPEGLIKEKPVKTPALEV